MPSSASCDVRSLVWRCFWRNNNKKISTEVKGECFLSKPSHSTLSLSLSICLLLYSVGIDTLLSLWSLLGLALFPSCPLCMLYVPFSSSSKVQGMLRSSFLVLSSFSVASSRLSVEVLSLSLLDPDVAFSSFFCAFISRLNFDSLSSLDCVFLLFSFSSHFSSASHPQVKPVFLFSNPWKLYHEGKQFSFLTSLALFRFSASSPSSFLCSCALLFSL